MNEETETEKRAGRGYLYKHLWANILWIYKTHWCFPCVQICSWLSCLKIYVHIHVLNPGCIKTSTERNRLLVAVTWERYNVWGFWQSVKLQRKTSCITVHIVNTNSEILGFGLVLRETMYDDVWVPCIVSAFLDRNDV